MRIYAGVALLVGLGIAAGTPEEVAKVERQRLQGTWVAVAVEYDGKAVEPFRGANVSFAGDVVTLRADGKEQKGTYTLDPTQRPKAIDLALAGPGGKKEIARGRYRLRGNDLTLCVGVFARAVTKDGETAAETPSERPAALGSRAGMLMTLRREAK